MVELLLESLNGLDDNHSPSFTMKSGSMGCSSPGRNTVMAMWSKLSELSHWSFPFYHYRFSAILIFAWCHNSGTYSGHTLEVMMGRGPPTTAFLALIWPSHPLQRVLCGHSCQYPICQIQEVDSWFLGYRHLHDDILKLVLSESADCLCGEQYTSRAQ